MAGFNQFFDDLNGTKTWRYGAAVDQKFTSTLFGGVELSQRDLNVAATSIDPEGLDIATRVDWHENLARSYLLWAPNLWLALRAEYQQEHYSRDELRTDGVLKMDTQRVPLGLSVFLPSGFSGTLTATYNNQHGVFDRLTGEPSEHGHDNFWLVDARLGYRLPKRYGFISVGAVNLFNQEFNYFDTDFNNPRIHSGRMVFGRVTLAIP